MKLEYIDATSDDFVESLLPWQELGLQETASGYGLRLTTSYKVPYKGRLYRVYASCVSNVASHWIKSL